MLAIWIWKSNIIKPWIDDMPILKISIQFIPTCSALEKLHHLLLALTAGKGYGFIFCS